jgi:hypothetical protein
MPETDSDLTADTNVTADPDETADTAHFRAFAARRDDDLPASWHLRAQRSRIGILAVAVVVVALLALVLGALLVS